MISRTNIYKDNKAPDDLWWCTHTCGITEILEVAVWCSVLIGYRWKNAVNMQGLGTEMVTDHSPQLVPAWITCAAFSYISLPSSWQAFCKLLLGFSIRQLLALVLSFHPKATPNLHATQWSRLLGPHAMPLISKNRVCLSLGYFNDIFWPFTVIRRAKLYVALRPVCSFSETIPVLLWPLCDDTYHPWPA